MIFIFSKQNGRLLLGFLLCGILFSVLAINYDHTPFISIDHHVGRTLYNYSNDFYYFFLLITYLGSGYFLFPLLGFLIIILCYQRQYTIALIFLVNYLGVHVLNDLLKEFFERERPSLYHLVSEDSYSFPSGHAMNSLAFYALLAYHFCKKQYNESDLLIPLWLFSGILILLIGTSRIYLGVHYFTDIIGGYLSGLTWLFISIYLYKRVERGSSLVIQG
ncbi:phosphatase PAP2 family protein [Ammoniphilus sp. 3BR4]|uniref:phosphatase PAP2 family protein n=1 Tax=Ammoniphilus sp. 3BR4 TaxID=3158265 RepID=UPI00346525F5